MSTCPACDESVEADKNFCRHCGAELGSETGESGRAAPDLAEPLSPEERVAAARHDSVTVERLTQSGNSNNPNVPQDEPIEAYLEPGEQPHYVLYNKGKGVAVGDTGSKTKPRATNIAYLVFTDARVLAIVATSDGDRALTIPYAAVDDYAVESKLLGNRVDVAAGDETYYLWVNGKFPASTIQEALALVDEFGRDDVDAEVTGLHDPPTSAEGEVVDLSDRIGDPRGSYVTEERIGKVEDVLDPDETVHYITRGSTVDTEGSGAGNSLFGDDRSRKSGTRGWVRAAFTDRRVVVKIPQWLGSDERTIPYRNITSVDLDTGLVNKRVTLQTAGQTYHIETHDPGKDECRDIVRFVRTKLSEANEPQQVASAEPDPTEQLKNIKELHDAGVLDDDEFEEKKQDLLDKI